MEDSYKRSSAVPFGTAVSQPETEMQALDSDAEELPAVVNAEDVSRYCPVCSKRLESRRCKLVCGVCGYYMSCADYY